MSTNGHDDDKTPTVFPRIARVDANTIVAQALQSNADSRRQRLKRMDAIIEGIFGAERPVDPGMLSLYGKEIRGEIADDTRLADMLDPPPVAAGSNR